jgi:rubrerythrin
VKPDAWLYDSITIKSNGREVESETARVDRKEHWPNERPLFLINTINPKFGLHRYECRKCGREILIDRQASVGCPSCGTSKKMYGEGLFKRLETLINSPNKDDETDGGDS